jgi:alpha-beta hydrolase superfamily lysophospholipase
VRRRHALATAAAALAAPAAHAKMQMTYPKGTKQRQVRFAAGDGTMLAGSLLLPLISEVQYVPGVVLVAGSGPTDRDGNNSGIAVKIDLLRQIAELLANAGIASLRYDKRGIGQSTKPPNTVVGAEAFFTWENFIGDVQAAHAELLRHDEVKPYATALLGHSEGGLLALAAAKAMLSRKPYAVVLAATPGLPLQEILRRQIERSAPGLVAPATRVMDAIRRTGHTPTDLPADLAPIFPAYIGSLLQQELAFDPAAALAVIDQACLLIHGGADQQVVPLGDIQPLIDTLGSRGKPGEALVAPLVSHNLKAVKNAADPGFEGPVAPAIADKLRSWLSFVLGA